MRVHKEVLMHVIVGGYKYSVCVRVYLLSRVSRKDGYRGEVGAVERERREKDNTIRTSCTGLPSHIDMK